MRFGEIEGATFAVDLADGTGRVVLAIARLRGVDPGRMRRLTGDPGELVDLQVVAQQGRVVVTLDDVQDVARNVFGGDEPGFVLAAGGAFTVLAATDVQAFALADGVIGHAVVRAEHTLIVERADLAGVRRQVAHQEFLERPLADEADAGRVFLHRNVQAGGGGDFAHLALVDAGQRKEGFRQLRLIQTVQEVALILAGVFGLEQLHATAAGRVGAHAGIVAGGDLLGAERQCVVEESAELDFRVAQHVRVGRATGGVLAEELGEYALLVFLGEIDDLDVDAEVVGDAHDVDQILPRRAVFLVVVVFPVFHEHADNPPAALPQEQGGDRRVDAAGKADDDGTAVARFNAFCLGKFVFSRHPVLLHPASVAAPVRARAVHYLHTSYRRRSVATWRRPTPSVPRWPRCTSVAA